MIFGGKTTKWLFFYKNDVLLTQFFERNVKIVFDALDELIDAKTGNGNYVFFVINFIFEDIAFVHDEEMNEEMGMTAVETIGGQEEHEIFKANGRYFFAAVVEINLAIAAKGSAEDNLGQFTVNNFVVVGDVDAVLVHYYFVCHD